MSELYVLARVADRLVAVPAASVDSVIDLGPLLPVPLAPPAVLGLAAVRSQVLTVVDVALALGEERLPPNRRRALTIAHHGHRYALLVDTVLEVVSATPVAEGRSVRLGERWARATDGTIATAGGYALVLRTDALVDAEPERAAA